MTAECLIEPEMLSTPLHSDAGMQANEALPNRKGLTSLPVVVIPARNEEALLPRLLGALSRQTVLARQSEPLEVVIVLNNSDDRSLQAATAAVGQMPRI